MTCLNNKYLMALSVYIIEYLISRGYEYEELPDDTYRIDGVPSVRVDNDGIYSFPKRRYIDQIEFCMDYLGMRYEDAIEDLATFYQWFMEERDVVKQVQRALKLEKFDPCPFEID